MELTKISIVIPSYNKVGFIDKTLKSIFDQKYDNLEVIIQDGASTDGTLEVIKRYLKRYPKEIKFESKKDKGQLDAVNKGMAKAVGQILTFINADDVYVKGAFLNIQKAFTENPKALWFAGRGIVINEKGAEIAKPITFYKNLLLSLDSKFFLLAANYLMQPSVFFTRQAYYKYGPFTGTTDFITEYDMWLKLAKEEMPVVLQQNLSRFRIEPSTKTKRLFSTLLKEDEKIVRSFTKNPLVLFIHYLHNLGRIFVRRFV